MPPAVTVTSGCSVGSKLSSLSLDLNVGYIQTLHGSLKVAHTMVGLVCLSVIAHYCQYFHPLTGLSVGFRCSNEATYFMLVSYGSFVTSVLLLASSLVSYFTASFLPKTVFEFVYHGVATLLYISASLALLVTVILSNADKAQYKEPGYGAKIAAAVLGLVNSGLYAGSTYFSFMSQKQLG